MINKDYRNDHNSVRNKSIERLNPQVISSRRDVDKKEERITLRENVMPTTKNVTEILCE